MADTKISAMTAAGSVAGVDVFPILQGGANKQATISLIPVDSLNGSTPLSVAKGGSGVASSTGSGTKVVLHTSPTLVTPVLGVATATSINKLTLTAPATGATITIADGKTLSVTDDATVAGSNLGDQTITLTGDVTGSGVGSFVATIATASVTLAKMADLATARFIGRTTAGTGVPESLTATQATAMLNVFGPDSGAGGVKGLAPATVAGDSAKYLRGDGTWVGGQAFTANKLSVFASTSSAELAGVISDETGTGALVFANTPTLVTPTIGVATATSINKVAITAPASSATLTIADGKTATFSNSITFAGSDATTITFQGTDTYVGRATTDTLTNKRITKRTGTAASSGTPTINTDTTDFYSLTAQAADITSFTTNLSGTPTEGQTLWIAITGTAARAITWGASFEASTIALPTTTVTTARLDVGFVWNTVTSKWRCVATC